MKFKINIFLLIFCFKNFFLDFRNIKIKNLNLLISTIS
jgi:hypothetical protein